MITHYVIAISLLVVMFILFLVISRSLNNVINHLTKLEYLLSKEYELQKETLAIKRMMSDETSSGPAQQDPVQPAKK